MQFTQFTVLALFASISTALPSSEINARDIEARAPIPASFAKHAVAAIAAFGPGGTKTMMHSRIGAAKAFQVSKVKKLGTVETTIFKAIAADKAGVYAETLKKYCIKKEEYCEYEGHTEAEWVEAWNEISKAWAEYAKQETVLATNHLGPDPNSFYKRIEEKVLEANHVKITIDDKIV